LRLPDQELKHPVARRVWTEVQILLKKDVPLDERNPLSGRVWLEGWFNTKYGAQTL